MYKLFSVDDHVIEHENVWQDRVPAKFKETAPKVITAADGKQSWTYDGKVGKTMGLNAVAGKPMSDWGMEPARFTDMIAGCYNPMQRSKDMLANGILASVCFPTLPRFGGALFTQFDDKELASVCVRAWNEFMLDEWCGSGVEGMFVPVIIGQDWDPELAAKEIRWGAERGARTFIMPENCDPLGLPSYWTDFYDPIWQACEELEMPICMHIGSSGKLYPGSADSPYAVSIATANVGSWINSVDLAMSPVFVKFPRLQVVWSEGGIGWVPPALERADRQVLRHKGWSNLPNDKLPSEVFRTNYSFCMIEEPWGIKQRHELGIDRVMWESDYPHADTPWPYTQRQVGEVFEGVPDDEVAAITYGNAERVFKWKMADAVLCEPEIRELEEALAQSSLGSGALAAREQSVSLATGR
jgi:predicted TIM-barrel fold metal-dependent hydrolase